MDKVRIAKVRYQSTHPKSRIHCLYLHRSHCGRRLIGMEMTHDYKSSPLAKYAMEIDDEPTKIVHDT
eukprot:11360908-Ditylum_brightwellii.AAC.1